MTSEEVSWPSLLSSLVLLLDDTRPASRKTAVTHHDRPAMTAATAKSPVVVVVVLSWCPVSAPRRLGRPVIGILVFIIPINKLSLLASALFTLFDRTRAARDRIPPPSAGQSSKFSRKPERSVGRGGKLAKVFSYECARGLVFRNVGWNFHNITCPRLGHSSSIDRGS